jgi:NTP pyrophosphatase (non-canonical NTP hydrolase)
MSNKYTDHLLHCIVEECAEVQKEIAKYGRFGDAIAPDNTTAKERLLPEIYDLLGVIQMWLEAEDHANVQSIEALGHMDTKRRKVLTYMPEDSRP